MSEKRGQDTQSPISQAYLPICKEEPSAKLVIEYPVPFFRSWGLRMNQPREQLRGLDNSLGSVRDEIVIHAVNATRAHRFQLRHFAPRFQRIAREAALRSLNKIEDD